MAKRLPEQQAWDDLGPQLKALTHCVDRIESITTGSGIPDITYSWKNGHGWIELKADMECEHVGHPVNLKHYTPMQRTWMRRRSGHGKNLWLMIRTAHGWYAVPGSLSWSLSAQPSHAELLSRRAWYHAGAKCDFKWLRQFL